jgi:hypothetical protein
LFSLTFGNIKTKKRILSQKSDSNKACMKYCNRKLINSQTKYSISLKELFYRLYQTSGNISGREDRG